MIGGDLGGLFNQAQKMQKELRDLQDELKDRVVVGESGGGMVKVYANGIQEVVKVEIDAAAVDPDDTEMLEDLVQVATQAALEKSRQLQQEETNRITGGISLPGMM
ncbi:MAG TPA: YbaB/EbfC family nucleoid-associated protein [Planctomycetes bacterium]|nr:YbaB/EbfC family nucleoid-associated protein [Planctomycetota bacterium]HIN80590.1 YbaB/EbfC family nucleoid-associated protein [Planctomycetota bacterium]